MYLKLANRRIVIPLALPTHLHKHWEWTAQHFRDADIHGNAEMMSSRLQGQWMIWMAEWIAPKRGQFSKIGLVI